MAKKFTSTFRFSALCFLVIGLFFVSGCTNDNSNNNKKTEQPKEYRKITIGLSTYDENDKYHFLKSPWYDAYRDELGIIVEPAFVVPVDKLSSKITISIASGDIPDLLPGLGRKDFDSTIRLGLAAKLDGLVEQYATPLTKEILASDGGYCLTSSSSNGSLYALPYVYGYYDNVFLMWIRQDWLDKLELEYPKNEKELYDVAYAFRNNDPDGNGIKDTYGFSSISSIWEDSGFFSMFGAQPFWSWYKEGDKLTYSTTYKINNIVSALSYMNKLYEAELYYPEFAIVKDDNYRSMLSDGKLGLAFDFRYFPYIVEEGIVKENHDVEWKAYPIPTATSMIEQARPFAYHGPAAYNVVSKDCKNPEAIIEMLNLFTEKIFSDKKDEYYNKFVLSEDGENLLPYALIQTDIGDDMPKMKNIHDALVNDDPSKLSKAELHYYKRCVEYENGNHDYWADYTFFGPDNASITLVSKYINEIEPMFSEPIVLAADDIQTMDGLDKLWLDACIEIIMGEKKPEYYYQYVETMLENGGRDIIEKVNQTKLEQSETESENGASQSGSANNSDDKGDDELKKNLAGLDSSIYCNFDRNEFNHTLGVWLWNYKEIYKPEIVFSFLTKNNITEIYLVYNSRVKFEDYKAFNKRAAESGIRVSLLGADVNWILEENASRADRFFKYYTDFQASCTEESEKFYGIHMDIEPHQLEQWRTDFDATVKLYMDFVIKCKDYAESVNTLSEFDIPFWFDGIDVEYNGQKMNLAEFCIMNMDTAVLMSYRDNAEAVYGCGEYELEVAKKYGTKIALGVETGHIYEEINITFDHLGTIKLYEELDKLVHLTQEKAKPSEVGYAIHHYNSWIELPEYGQPLGEDFPADNPAYAGVKKFKDEIEND